MQLPLKFRSTIMIVACAFLLALPSIVNGKPFLFFDSVHYYEIGKSIVGKLTGVGSQDEASTSPAAVEDETTTSADAAESQPQSEATPAPGAQEANHGALASIAAGRSPIYAILTFVLSGLFSTYGLVAFQSVIVGWVVFRFLDLMLGAERDVEKLVLVGVLAVLTPAGFHAGFIMPDVFAGVYVLAALVLLLDRKVGRVETLVFAGLLAFAATMHTTIVALGLVLLTLAVAARLLPWTRALVNSAASVCVLASIVLALGFSAVYKWGTERITGEELRNAPYLMARVIADGPGHRLLEERCDELDFAVCQFRGVQYFDHNDFLWGSFGQEKNFANADPATQEALQDEESRFVRTAVLAYPWMQLGATMRNTLNQMRFAGIYETHQGAELMMSMPVFAQSDLMRHVPNLDACTPMSDGCAARQPFREGWGEVVRYFTLVGMIALLAFAVWRLPKLFTTADGDPQVRAVALAAAVFVIVLVANAVVCGSLSAPHDRYQARLAWGAVLILGAGLLQIRARQARLVQAQAVS